MKVRFCLIWFRERPILRTIKHGLTTGPPRSSWAETLANAMTRTAMLMTAFIVCIYVLTDQIWELWGLGLFLCRRPFGRTRRPDEQTTDPNPSEDISFRFSCMIINVTVLDPGTREPEVWFAEGRQTTWTRMILSDFGSHNPNPEIRSFGSFFIRHPSHKNIPNPALRFNLNKCQP